MKRFPLLALLALLIVALAFAGCGGGGGGSTSGGLDEPPDAGGGDNGGDDDVIPGDPFTVKFVTGQIVNQSNVGVANVKVIFTNKASLVATYSAISKADGSFQINLNSNSVLSLFDLPATFAVDTFNVKTTYPTNLDVSYDGLSFAQTAIPVPASVLGMEQGSLGKIVVKSTTPGGGGDGGGTDPPDLPPGF